MTLALHPYKAVAPRAKLMHITRWLEDEQIEDQVLFEARTGRTRRHDSRNRSASLILISLGGDPDRLYMHMTQEAYAEFRLRFM